VDGLYPKTDILSLRCAVREILQIVRLLQNSNDKEGLAAFFDLWTGTVHCSAAV